MLGTSTRPVFTCFETMERVRTEVYERAAAVYDGYIEAGLRERIPFFGAGMQYIRFARGGAELYRLFVFEPKRGIRYNEGNAAYAGACPPGAYGHLRHNRRGSGYLFSGYVVLRRTAWCTLIVTGDCPYSDREIGEIFTGLSVSIYKAIKEIPVFAEGTFDRRRYFGGLTVGQGREAEYENNSPEKGKTMREKVYSKLYNGRVL